MKTEPFLFFFNFVKLTGCVIEKSKEVAIMLLGLKYRFWCLVSYHHCVRMSRCVDKQVRYIRNDYMFRYFGLRFIYHCKMFDMIQVRMDTLKAKIINKYPDLAD